MSDTIFSLSSAPGRGGVAIIRVSGEQALEGLQKTARLTTVKPRYAYFCHLKNPRTKDLIDQSLCLYFKAPHSFTGEDTVEYHVHGGRAVVESLLSSLSVMEGYRLAEPGEFTKRAFMNDKMDLTEAEAVADLIHAETEAQKQQALSQLSGQLSKIYQDWSDHLKKILAHQEADIEFPEDDMPDGISEVLQPKLKDLMAKIQDHLNDNRRGERLREGIHITILGAPNAGKSSLTNLLAERDVAIVSDQAGTTRDVIEVHLDLGGYPVVISDTAGLREVQDNQVETEGISRARQRAGEADLKIVIFDGSKAFDEESLQHIDDDSVVVINKQDLIKKDLFDKISGQEPLFISAVTGEGVRNLLDVLTLRIKQLFDISSQTPSLTRQRHRFALEEAVESINRALEADFPELGAEDIRMAMRAIGRITGHVDVEDLLDVIFKDFCIGK